MRSGINFRALVSISSCAIEDSVLIVIGEGTGELYKEVASLSGLEIVVCKEEEVVFGDTLRTGDGVSVDIVVLASYKSLKPHCRWYLYRRYRSFRSSSRVFQRSKRSALRFQSKTRSADVCLPSKMFVRTISRGCASAD